MANRFSITPKFGKLPKLPKLPSLTSSDKPKAPQQPDPTADLPAPVDTGPQPGAHQAHNTDWNATYSTRPASTPRHTADSVQTPRPKAGSYRQHHTSIVNSHPLYDLGPHTSEPGLPDSATVETSNSSLTLADLAASETTAEHSESLPTADTQSPTPRGNPDSHAMRSKRSQLMQAQKKRPARLPEKPSELRAALYSGHLHTNAEIERLFEPRNHHYSVLLKKRIAAAAKTQDPKQLLALMEQLNRGGPTVLHNKADRKDLLKPLLALCTDPHLSAEDRQAVFEATLPMLPKPFEFDEADLAQNLCFSMIVSLQDADQRQRWQSMYQQAMGSPRAYAQPAAE